MKLAARVFLGGLVLTLLASAADITGLWTGQVTGRGGEKQDISFEFKSAKNQLAGTMFGDEFDLPLQDLKILDDRISFYITQTNYYDGRQQKFLFSGTITDKEIQLTRERAGGGPVANSAKKQDTKQTFTLKRLTS